MENAQAGCLIPVKLNHNVKEMSGAQAFQAQFWVVLDATQSWV